MYKLLVVITTCNVIAFAKLPVYIHKCSIKDPNISTCVLENAKQAIPHIIKGERKLKIPVLDPLFVTELRVVEEGLEAAILNSTVTGLKDIELGSIGMNLDKKEFLLEGKLPYLNFTGNYTINGKVVTLPITGNGPFTSSFRNLTLSYKIIYDLMKLEDGEVYMVFVDYDMDIVPEHVICHLENMFNGNAVLGEIMNTFLNENWRAIYKDLGKPTSRAVGKILFTILAESSKTVPYKDIFDDVE